MNNLTSPPVTAQTDVELTCDKLTFVDKTGEPLFRLQAKASTRANETLVFFHRAGQRAVSLTSSTAKNRLAIQSIGGIDGVVLSTTYEHGGRVRVSKEIDHD